RAIQIVEQALERHGAPVYVRHEIVHNKHVVDTLKAKGVIFVEELDEIPDTGQPVIFSAHGVPKSVPQAAEQRQLNFVDATCPLVSKVHIEAIRHHAQGREILLVGHAGHAEVVGTMGQLPPNAIQLVETEDDAKTIVPKNPGRLAYVTQTTLSVDDTSAIVARLKQRFPKIVGPHKQDICYATTNRQEAVKALAARADVVIIVGSPNSSNSRRLVEVAQRFGKCAAFLVQDAGALPWKALEAAKIIGLSAGASAPEALVEEILEAFRQRRPTHVETVTTARENVVFKLPRDFAAASPG
ncbi:MAG: 4-hydroxy-3-methylbut-2-enyl diphosphate reductase, partial [Alphaproteobacteria bacterium]